MCDKWKELDFEIARCEQLKLRAKEPLFAEALEALLESYRKEGWLSTQAQPLPRTETVMSPCFRWPTN